MVPDPLLDDQSLVLKGKRGLVIILGCTHSGLINTLRHVVYSFENETLDTIVGGTHLGFFKDDQLDQTISHLTHYNFNKIGLEYICCRGGSVCPPGFI